MTQDFLVRARAEYDIQTAFDRYESERLGLGDEFLERFESIRNFPESFPIVYGNIRRAVVRRFPFLVFYTGDSACIRILAVLHHSRSPARWPRQ